MLDHICRRGRIGSFEGIEFIVHPKENGRNKPHLHARYQGKETVLAIPDGEVIAGNLHGSKMKQASRWIVENQDFIKAKWDELVDGVVCFG